MEYTTRWEKIKEEAIGQGGQSKVYEVIDKQKFITTFGSIPSIIQSLADRNIGGDTHLKFIDKFSGAIMDFVKWHDPNNHGALKVLHQPEDARDFERAAARIKREIEAMANLDHPNLLKILDKDDEAKWFVSQFYSRGTLGNKLNLFKGSISKALNAFRPLVEAVSLIHNSNKIHRDIKPQNIFLDSEDNLILGDFGIVFFKGPEHTRISDTFENVGSRDWMPGWAQRVRIEDVNPSFDIYGLGKVLWSMISGTSFLRLWYFDRPEFNLEIIFPKNRFMKLINRLFSKCIVEDEGQCIENVGMLLEEINQIQSVIEENASLVDPKLKFPCKLCGVGYYGNIERKGDYTLHNFGLRPASGHDLKIYACDHCGNVQIFDFRDFTIPPLWKED